MTLRMAADQGVSRPNKVKHAQQDKDHCHARSELSLQLTIRPSVSCTGRGGEKRRGRRRLLCNEYFSTMRAATDKRSSSVERVGQIGKG